ncbi:LacI family transcriptional regulator, partial [Arthrobacter deserti]|nr:LacI family transcriptional regulator [Arthrobacter deserti]
NRAARQLRTQTSETIGLYIAPDVRNMPFYMPFAFGATDMASRLDFDLMLISRTTSHSESWKHLCGAVVIDALPGDPTVGSLLASGIPVVSAGRLAGDDAALAAGVIEVEHAPMCAALLQELRRHGAKNPALIAPEARDPLSWSQLIRDGYAQWCGQNGVEPVIVSLPPFPDNTELEAALELA